MDQKFHYPTWLWRGVGGAEPLHSERLWKRAFFLIPPLFIFYSMQKQLLKSPTFLTNLTFHFESFLIVGVIFRNKTCVILTVFDNLFPNLSISCTVWLPKKKGLTNRGNSWSATFFIFFLLLACNSALPLSLRFTLRGEYTQCFFEEFRQLEIFLYGMLRKLVNTLKWWFQLPRQLRYLPMVSEF